MHFPMIADNLQSPEHGANSKETQEFCSYYADGGYLLSVDIANTVEDGFRGGEGACARHDRSRVAGSVCERLEV